MKPLAPKIASASTATHSPASAGVCILAFSHWSMKIVTNSAVMQKSMPVRSNGMICPSMPPRADAAVQ